MPEPIHFNQTDTEKIDREIIKLLDKGVIERTTHSENEFISNIFFRTKKDGSIRLILNLRKLNEEVVYHHFKMETLQHAIQSMSPGCFMASVDLKDAYYSIPVCIEDRKYLRFLWKGALYQFTCLPNGLAEAPRKFTKILKVPFAYLRARGHSNSAYIDDSFLNAGTVKSCADTVITTVSLLDGLGFTVHPDKSCFVPTQRITYLGFVLDSVEMRVRLTYEKAEKIVDLCTRLKNKTSTTIRECAEVLGNLVAAEPGVELAALHYKRIEHEKIQALKVAKGDYESHMIISDSIREDLDWWIANVHLASKQIMRAPPTADLFSDSSNAAWGATFEGRSAGGPWAGDELHWHINEKELQAVFFGLQTFCGRLHDTHLRLNIDNTTSVAYVNNQGGRKPALNEIARNIWNWAQERKLWLSAVHIPGVENVEADRASRSIYDLESEWQLNQEIFQILDERWGPFDMDLFASRLNFQCKRFMAWKPDPLASAIDALAHPWSNIKGYAFPPFSLIGRSLQKVVQDRASVLMIVPLWTTQPWFTKLLELTCDHPYLLPLRSDLLILPQDPGRTHPILHKLHLAAFPLSGTPSRSLDYQSQLPSLSSELGDQQLQLNIGRIGPSGSHFAVNGRCLHCRHLCRT